MKQGFTLIELLAVVAIIVVLSALIIPVVNKVRMSGFEAQGLSNLRQIGQAYLLAAQEQNGILPGYKSGGQLKDNWDRIVNGILTDQTPINHPAKWSTLFKDPSAFASGAISTDNGSKYHFAPVAAITRGTGGRTGGAAPKALRTYDHLLQHQFPSRQILLADAGVDTPDSGVWGDMLHSESFSWSGNWNGKVDVTKAKLPIKPGGSGGGEIRWTNEKAKFFFLDGHVEKRHQADVLRYNLNPLFP